MTQALTASISRSWLWVALLLTLVVLRLPTLVQPAGGDQGLYRYIGQRIAEGEVPYRNAWEQKPPAVFYIYSALSRVWPGESMVAGADLIAAVLTAGLLIGVGRRLFGGRVGEGAAVAFLLLGDPAIQRLGGMNVRAQCETFIAVAVTAAVALAWRAERRPLPLLAAGAALGLTFWLKYNALAFALPVGMAAVLASPIGRHSALQSLAWIAAGAAGVFAVTLALFGMSGALTDLWLGTVVYNVRYSGETYGGPWHALRYLLTFPLMHARVDGLWFVGGLGAAGLLLRRFDRATLVVLAWLAAACLSIAVNGSRGLPQYFLQAAPALALAGAAGFAAVWLSARTAPGGRVLAVGMSLALAAGAWRVGSEPTPLWQPRAFGLPQAATNLFHDVRRLTGGTSPDTYLARFGRGETGKYSPLAVRRLAQRVREVSGPLDPIFVFGFASGGVLADTERRSASRFFWSRPIVLEFAADRPGYGSAGLLQDLQARPPAIIALQKQDWGLAEANVANSREYFLNTPALREWLYAGYEPDYQDAAFDVWRRRG